MRGFGFKVKGAGFEDIRLLVALGSLGLSSLGRKESLQLRLNPHNNF